ncbi:hypothetical protein KSP39_PZI004412 [Platanthera zijinensis]|uniref:Uncharacterized protein n=1 Tax=Platanthera zijinensis TaxID=2320716 RepID=A0AAP0GC52_9ASPA
MAARENEHRRIAVAESYHDSFSEQRTEQRWEHSTQETPSLQSLDRLGATSQCLDLHNNCVDPRRRLLRAPGDWIYTITVRIHGGDFSRWYLTGERRESLHRSIAAGTLQTPFDLQHEEEWRRESANSCESDGRRSKATRAIYFLATETDEHGGENQRSAILLRDRRARRLKLRKQEIRQKRDLERTETLAGVFVSLRMLGDTAQSILRSSIKFGVESSPKMTRTQ